ncbi:hypothetical protein CVD28_02080 [Bacillus sp. M6-12]|uniref:hypothetical protein n=1 Tax=Bacillus sp. M6-12 TaxID=2054166 RepID=UPI000C767350|nr:hypothetical protein [Bacillus sp. M6-12]PLS19220.1 hypothetical protein CVD28_02080 [Bacillus sp. M6-12]
MVSEAQVLFKEEEIEKKKIGRNLYNRKGYRTGGMRLGDAYLQLSKEEKEKLNGDITHFNLNKILTVSEYNALSEDMKKLYINHWTKNYPFEEVAGKFGSSQVLKFECKRFGLGLESVLKTVQKKDVHKAKEDFISFEVFKAFSKEEQISYLKKLKKGKLLLKVSKAWGKSDSYAYVILNNDKKQKAVNNKSKKEVNQNQTTITGIISFKEFSSLSKKEQFNYLTKLRNADRKISFAKISRQWGKNNNYLRNAFFLLKNELQQGEVKVETKEKVENKTNIQAEEKKMEIVAPPVTSPATKEEKKSDFQFNIEKEGLSLEELQQLLTGFAPLLKGQALKIKLSIES